VTVTIFPADPWFWAIGIFAVLWLLDIFGIRAYLWKWDAAVTRRIVAGGLVGTLGGALTISWLDDSWIRIMIGVIALGFLAWSYVPRRSVAKPSNAAGWFLSALSGMRPSSPTPAVRR